MDKTDNVFSARLVGSEPTFTNVSEADAIRRYVAVFATLLGSAGRHQFPTVVVNRPYEKSAWASVGHQIDGIDVPSDFIFMTFETGCGEIGYRLVDLYFSMRSVPGTFDSDITSIEPHAARLVETAAKEGIEVLEPNPYIRFVHNDNRLLFKFGARKAGKTGSVVLKPDGNHEFAEQTATEFAGHLKIKSLDYTLHGGTYSDLSAIFMKVGTPPEDEYGCGGEPIERTETDGHGQYSTHTLGCELFDHHLRPYGTYTSRWIRNGTQYSPNTEWHGQTWNQDDYTFPQTGGDEFEATQVSYAATHLMRWYESLGFSWPSRWKPMKFIELDVLKPDDAGEYFGQHSQFADWPLIMIKEGAHR